MYSALLCSRVGHNYKTGENGSLTFGPVEKQDEADYRCKAKNLYGTAVSDYARLTVEAGAEIMESPDSSRVQQGEKVKEKQGGHVINPLITRPTVL